MRSLRWVSFGVVVWVGWLTLGSVEGGAIGVMPAEAAGGCGIGFHRGPYGGCRPNVYGGYYGGGGYYRGGAVYGGRAVYGRRVYGGRVYGGRGVYGRRVGVYRGFHGGGRGFRGGGRFRR